MGRVLSKVKPAMLATNHKPLVVVLGCTGAGKSKLALEIATRIQGEIISADAMQIYKGLDIVTNKVTEEELKSCPHHFIGFLSPHQQYTVVDFQEQSLKVIDEIHERNKVPVLVGGTNYYVESVLWDHLIRIKEADTDLIPTIDTIRKELYQLSFAELHKRLSEVDPVMASMTHPKDKRKVIRGLEVYQQTGKPMSEHITLQRQQSGGTPLGGPLRFPNSCVMWVNCDPAVLQARIRKRVDKMMSRGLLKELSDFHDRFNRKRLQDGLVVNYEDGIFQSIGFKEFHEYLTSTTSDEKVKEKMLVDAVERMKLSTWQYAKYQKKWITKRIVNRHGCNLPVYSLDATDQSFWEDNVLNPALKIIKSFYPDVISLSPTVESIQCPEPMQKKTNLRTSDEGKVLRPCSVCDGKLILSQLWEDHLKSKAHKHQYRLWKNQVQETSNLLGKRHKELFEVQQASDVKENNAVFFDSDFVLFEEDSPRNAKTSP